MIFADKGFCKKIDQLVSSACVSVFFSKKYIGLKYLEEIRRLMVYAFARLDTKCLFLDFEL